MKSIKNLTLIDDDDLFVFLTMKTIKKTGLVERIGSFSNGLEALKFLKGNKDNAQALPEIILLDLSMPIMDGWQFMEEFATIKFSNKKKIAVYICSSSISPADIARTELINEVSDYIIKPISKDKLIGVIRDYS